MLVPAALAFAQFPGWWQLVATLGLFLGLDVLVAYVVEPIVIGAKTGVSSMAMLVSAIFWSWLWGPVGLVLSTPLTVCLAVLGKHVPRLSYLAVLLDDDRRWRTSWSSTTGLLSGDEEEAHEILDKRFRDKTRRQVFDEIIIPALLLADRDRARGEISESDHQHVVRTIRALADTPPHRSRDSASARPSRRTTGASARIVGVSARTVTDETIWEMLAQLFDPAKVQLESVGSSYLASDRRRERRRTLPRTCRTSFASSRSRRAAWPRHATSAGACARSCPGRPSWSSAREPRRADKRAPSRLTEDGAGQVCFTLEEARDDRRAAGVARGRDRGRHRRHRVRVLK